MPNVVDADRIDALKFAFDELSDFNSQKYEALESALKLDLDAHMNNVTELVAAVRRDQQSSALDHTSNSFNDGDLAKCLSDFRGEVVTRSELMPLMLETLKASLTPLAEEFARKTLLFENRVEHSNSNT